MSSSMSLSRTKFDSNQKAFNQLRISCKSIYNNIQHQNYMKENIEDAGPSDDQIEERRIPTHGGAASRLGSRDPRESLSSGPGREEVVK